MTTLEIYTYPGSHRVQKTQIAAQYNGVELKFPAFEMGKTNKTPDFLARFPTGKVPAMSTPDGPLFESGAIAKYVARLRGDTGLLGYTAYHQAQVDQWIDYANTEIEPARGAWLLPIFGIQKTFNPKQIVEAKKDILATVKLLDNYLFHHTYLVGNQITLADITIVTQFVELVKRVLTAESLKQSGNFVRWFVTCINQKQFRAVLGDVVFAKAEEQAKKAEKAGGEEKKEKKDAGAEKSGERKEKPKGKEGGSKKEQTKKENQPKKEGGKKDGAKKEGGKKEGGKKEDGAKAEQKGKAGGGGGKKEQKEATPPADDGDDDEDKPKGPKVKNPLDLLPASPMIFDATKKLFYSERPYNKAFFPAFWGPAKNEEAKMTTFDPSGYSVWTCRYKYEDEFTQYFLAQNLLGGFVQRLDKLRKYGMGCLMLTGESDEKKPWRLIGVWMFRGQGIPAEMNECDDSEHYNFVKLDMSTDANKKLFQDYLTGDVVDGLQVLDRRNFK